MGNSDSHSATTGTDEAENESKINENDEDMPLGPIARVPVQMDRGQPRSPRGKSEDYCDRGSLFALRR